MMAVAKEDETKRTGETKKPKCCPHRLNKNQHRPIVDQCHSPKSSIFSGTTGLMQFRKKSNALVHWFSTVVSTLTIRNRSQ